MTLAEALAQDVPQPTRTKGNRYFLGGAVRDIEGSKTHVTATVRGSQWYQVELRREGDAIVGSCECPYFIDRSESCKHLWAVVLAADASGYLVGDAPISENTYLDLEINIDDDLDLDLEPDLDQDLDDSTFVSAGRASASSAPSEPWRRFLSSVRQRVVRDTPAAPGRFLDGELLYVIDREATLATGAPMMQVQWRVRKKNGAWSKAQPAAISVLDVEGLPDEADRQILAPLLGASDAPPGFGSYSSVYSRASFTLHAPLIQSVVPLMARSGRFHLLPAPAATRSSQSGRVQPSELVPLSWDDGPPWRFELEVAVIDDRTIRVDGVLVRGDTRMPAKAPDLVLAGGFLIADGSVARLDHRGAFAWLTELRRSEAPLIPVSEAPALIEAMAHSNVAPADLPPSLRYEIVEAQPRPRIRIARSSKAQGQGRREELEAAVQFDYAGTIVPAGAAQGSYDADRRVLIRRDQVEEQRALQKLQGLGFHRPWYYGAHEGSLSVAVDRFPDAVRALVDDGWYVEAEGRVFRAARSLDMQVKSGIDWFELHGRVDFGDGRSAPMTELLAALRRGEATVLLDDGSRGLVPEEWLRRYARVAAFGEAAGDHVRYRPTQTALLDALLETQPAVRVDDAFQRARAELAQFEGVQPRDPPPTFRGTLRDYQRDALGWFAFLRRFGFGGCLADDMGLGKTVMVLALLEERRLSTESTRPRPSLAVVPRSLVFNWTEEAARFAPELRVLDFTGPGRDLARLDEYDLVLTTYGTLRREATRLTEHEFDYVILDEAQAIKNAQTASAKAARLARGRFRLALSGTPIENHLGELWSLFEFLNPGFLGAASTFGRTVAPAGRPERSDRLDLTILTRAFRPFILRRTKEQVTPELPPMFEQTIHCELEPAERRFYDELRAHYRQTLLAAVTRKGINRSKIQVLEALLRLRQAASHVGLVDEKRSGGKSAKFEMLLSRLRELADEGHKALVFSQFTTLLGLLRNHLHAEGIAYEYLDGQTRDRAERVARFEQDGACPVFLISLKAGGVGLNLASADYVFLLDPWWNPAVEAQAISRAHRIGQSRPVFAYRLLTRDTVEEKIAELQQSKRELADALFSEDAGFMKMLKPEDLDWLLS